MVQATTVKFSAFEHTRGIRRMALGLVVAVAGTLAVSAWAQGHGNHGGDFGGPGMFMGRGDHGGRGLDRMLDSVNATDAQRTQIKQIAQTAAADLKTQRAASRGLHEQGLQLFTAPVVDARAVEALRVQRLAQHDQASKRITQAMLDISAVLTPEQRVKLGERIKQRAQRMQEHMQNRGAASGPSK
ncbi:MAG: Spy/CpxP family protein refolding chaperone [Cytophagales bacterium]|nr:Spy/CpxP family protein refolding chaperone [Rhizobacter sp.]